MPESGKRIFTFEQARELLPEVREMTRRALEELSGLDEDADDGERGDEARRLVTAWARAVEALGAEAKGTWLVDFDCGSGYYCWRWPEEALEFFHGYTEGFAGRMRIQ